MVCALVSGGLDSSVLLWDLLRRRLTVRPLYVRAGMRWEAQELEVLRAFLRRIRSRRLLPLAVIEVPMSDLYGRHWSTTGARVPGLRAANESVYLPGRNLALLSKAATYCAMKGIRLLATGVLDSNPFPDATPAFFRALQTALRLGLDAPIRIETPYRGLSKEEVIRRGRGLPLDLTLSCARPRRRRHCGRCTKCAERILAFRRSGVPDPTDYGRRPGDAGSAPGTLSREPAARRARTMRVAPKKATRLK
ncbi:MAG TPA: 7-cyano-7-deazaguanine synthase [Candidatus Polarisedimenticolia bacterium]|nr:7-cyano-7-deazaguanine synthase [Candidatus Polarisedimenticolia bacterium]